tara:strand:- start:3914 stop:5575 length:1662 start_codon:yes stop_codon:yes gene_type:complete
MISILRLNKEDTIALLVKGKDKKWVMDTETDGLEVKGPNAKNEAKFIGLMPYGSAFCLIVERKDYDDWELEKYLKKLTLVGHNLKFDLHALNLQPEVCWEDTLNACYFNNTAGRKSMDHIAKMNGWKKIATPDLLKQGKIAEVPESDLEKYLADDCYTTWRMAERFQMDRCKFDYRVEKAVYEMECRGVRLLPEKLSKVDVRLNGLINEADRKLRHAGFNGDGNSPKQVGEWLVSRGRALPKTAKGNISTSKIVLQKLADKGDGLVQMVLDWRKAVKLKSAFIDPLPKLAQNGMLYPSTNTTLTKTGRFSCSGPNLQQIPKRGALGKSIRDCMTSENRSGVTACDFSQVELRVAASLANEEVLLSAFASGGDPHTEVAAKMLGKKVEDIQPEERFKAKAVNFGILNGMGAKRLAIELKSTYDEANRFLSEYKRNLPRLNEWMEGVWREAEAYGLARTISGRTRPFLQGEETRSAISVVVQGSAAELMRHSLVAVSEAGLEPILSVHDEIIIPGMLQGEKLKEVMEYAANNAYNEFRNVSFEAEATAGITWGNV